MAHALTLINTNAGGLRLRKGQQNLTPNFHFFSTATICLVFFDDVIPGLRHNQCL